MKTLFRILRSLFRLHYTYGNPLDLQQARGLLWMCWGAILALIVGIIYQFGDARPADDILYIANLPLRITDTIYAVVYGLTALGLYIVVLLVNRGSLVVGRVLFVSALFFFGLAFYVLNSLSSFLLFALSMPIIAAGVLFNRRGLVMTLLLTGLTLITLVVFTQIGLLDVVLSRPFELSEILAAGLLVLGVDGITLAVFASGQRVLLQHNLALSSELNNLAAVSQAVGSAETVEGILIQMVEMTRDQLGYYHVQIFLVEEKSGVITLATGTGLGYAEQGIPQRRIAPDDFGIINQVVRAGETQRITITAPEHRRTEFLPATRAELLVPLRHRNRVLGVLDVQSIQADAFTAQDIAALEAIGAQIAGAIENARLAEALRVSNQERQELLEQLRTVDRQIERLSRGVGGHAWAHYLENRPDQVVGFDWNNGVLTPSYQPLILQEADPNPRVETRDGAQVLCVPVISRGQALGLMEFKAPDGQIWDHRSIELARAIAQRLALSLDNLRLFEQAQMAVAREQIANQIATVLQTKGDIDSLVQTAVEAFQQALGATQTSIRLGIPKQDQATLPGQSTNGGTAS